MYDMKLFSSTQQVNFYPTKAGVLHVAAQHFLFPVIKMNEFSSLY